MDAAARDRGPELRDHPVLTEDVGEARHVAHASTLYLAAGSRPE
jgi:hypothetical protein